MLVCAVLAQSVERSGSISGAARVSLQSERTVHQHSWAILVVRLLYVSLGAQGMVVVSRSGTEYHRARPLDGWERRRDGASPFTKA